MELILVSKLLRSKYLHYSMTAIIYVHFCFDLDTIFNIFRISIIYLNNCRYVSILYVHKYDLKILNVIERFYLKKSNVFEYYYKYKHYSLINNSGIYLVVYNSI